MGKIILTGDRPTGRLHVGHYVGSLRRRVELQNSGEYEKIFIMIADAQALTDNIENPEKVRQNILEVALDYLSCGIDPEKTTILIQSQIPELYELTAYYMDLVTVSRLQRNPTVKSEIQMRNFEASIPVGFFTYPISQAADITAFKATTVPVGVDQLPMIEQTKEIVHKFNSVYAEVLVDPDALLPENQACMRLPGIDGKAKMSKSLGNCIYLSDTADEVKKKIMSMYTDPTHIQVSDPGHIEGNTVFTYLDAFCRPEHFERYLPDYANLDELKAHYQRGGLGDVKVKRFLNSVLEETLEPIRARRKEFEKDIPGVYQILKRGSEAAEEVAAQTLSEVKDAMKINYFSDQELIRSSLRSTAEANKFRDGGSVCPADVRREACRCLRDERWKMSENREEKCCCGRHKHRSEEEEKALLNRLNRIEGQIRGIKNMVEDERYCIDILNQVSAVQAALNSFNRILLTDHIHTCVVERVEKGDTEVIDELCRALQKLMK